MAVVGHQSQGGCNMIDPRCKKCRRAGEKLFLRGERCFSPKCAMIKKNYPPGIHGQRPRRPLSEYGLQLRNKKKVCQIYGLKEKQLRRYLKGGKEKLLINLETRLDNVCYRLGFASSRAQSRQLVSHRHIKINERKINIPSYQVKIDDVISSFVKSKLKSSEVPDWLSLDKGKQKGQVKKMPQEKNIESIIDLSKIIEFYSR